MDLTEREIKQKKLRLLELEEQEAQDKLGGNSPQPAISEPTTTANPMDMTKTAIQRLFMPKNPGTAPLEYSLLPTQNKANAGLAMLNSLTFGGVGKGLRAISPTLPQPTPEQQIVGEAAGLAVPMEKGLKAVGGVAKFGGNMVRTMAKESPFIRQISEMVRKPFVETGKKLGEAIDKYDMASESAEFAGKEASTVKKVSLEDTLNKVMEDMVDNPAIQSAVNRSPSLKKLIANPELAKDVTLRQSQNIINELKGTAAIQSKLAGNSKYMPLDRDVVDLTNLIRADQLDVFPQFAKNIGDYKKVASNYWKLKNLANPVRATSFMMGETSGFGNAVLRDSLKELAPQAIEKIRAFRLAKKLPKYAVPAAIGGGAGILVNEVMKK